MPYQNLDCTNNKEIEKGPFHLKQPNHKNNNLPDE